MKLLITGSRTLKPEHYQELKARLERYREQITEVLHGGAAGADQLASRWAQEHGKKETVIKPDYTKHPGKWAPLIRNQELAERCTHCVALISGQMTNGTEHTRTQVLKRGKPVRTWNLNAV